MVTISERKLEVLMRKVVRQTVREELQKLVKRQPRVIEPWMSNPESPLYQGMQDLLKRKKEGRLKFHTYEEVFGE
jgi:hypothetical protein